MIPQSKTVLPGRETIKASTSQMLEKILLSNYTPACVVINEKCEVFYIMAETGRYLEPASGEPPLIFCRWPVRG